MPDRAILIVSVASPDFVSRVTSLPLVGTALRAYEHGKASSRVVKVRLSPLPCAYMPILRQYGAEMMESSVKNISRPVIDRLPVDVNQLDEFACRQLDRVCLHISPSSHPHRPFQLHRYRCASTPDDKMLSHFQDPTTAPKISRNHDVSVFGTIDEGTISMLSCLHRSDKRSRRPSFSLVHTTATFSRKPHSDPAVPGSHHTFRSRSQSTGCVTKSMAIRAS